MAAIQYKVKLAESERTRLNEVSHRGLGVMFAPASGRWRCSKQVQNVADREIAGCF